jgi:hypothetical protein
MIVQTGQRGCEAVTNESDDPQWEQVDGRREKSLIIDAE